MAPAIRATWKAWNNPRREAEANGAGGDPNGGWPGEWVTMVMLLIEGRSGEFFSPVVPSKGAADRREWSIR